MKLVSFLASGHPSYGIVSGDGIIDLGRRWGDRHETLRAAIAADAFGQAATELRDAKADLSLSSATLLPPIPNPEKIICVGLNYKDHAAESGAKIPDYPAVFLRLTNTLVGHGSPMICPKVSGNFDYEGELALVIGKPGRYIAERDALTHVFGYACFNDGSIRDYQFKHSLDVGKNFGATGGFGPWLVTRDEIADPSQLTLSTRINGVRVQHKKTNDMIFSVPAIIAYLSTWTELVPGDVITTGTPEGVGFSRKPPLWLKPGDTVEIEISGIGLLRNPVAAE
jgi:2-keto-4-pentenoate hydratase/2-oxohepta-3-ene-1,7-dioic acid hydratase in catechol pathway